MDQVLQEVLSVLGPGAAIGLVLGLLAIKLLNRASSKKQEQETAERTEKEVIAAWPGVRREVKIKLIAESISEDPLVSAEIREELKNYGKHGGRW